MSNLILRLCLGAALLSFAVGALAAGVTPAPAMMPVLNVKDFGAVGDGKADDTDAILQAMKMAGKPNPNKPGETMPTTVFIPTGIYRITKTLNLNTTFQMNHLLGEGALKNSTKAGYSTLMWDGEAGKHMFDFQGYLALRLSELRLDGNGKADVQLRINSVPGVGTGLWYFERINLTNAGTGVELGADLDNCSSDMTFVDCNIDHMKSAGFRTMNNQNVDYVFIRCIFTWTPIGVHFVKGGVGHFILPAFGRVRTAIKIDQGGINGGVYSITGLQLETFNYDSEKKRFTILDVQGETCVTLDAIYTGCGQVWGPNGDYETPNFIIGPNAQVSVSNSMISGRVAVMKGTAVTTGDEAGSSWLQFENCRFRCYADPLKTIQTDDNSGFALRNCFVIHDNTMAATPEEYYNNLKPLFIPSYVKYPKNTPIYQQEQAAPAVKPVINKPAPTKPVINKPLPGRPKIG